MLERLLILSLLLITAILIPGLLIRSGGTGKIDLDLLTSRGIKLNRAWPSVIYFWSSYCAPCISQSVIFNNLRKKYRNVNFVSLNAAEEKEISMSLNIKTVPSIAVLSSEKEILFFNQGFTGGEKLKKEIDKIIEDKSNN